MAMVDTYMTTYLQQNVRPAMYTLLTSLGMDAAAQDWISAMNSLAQ
jgi:hypothetical protein